MARAGTKLCAVGCGRTIHCKKRRLCDRCVNVFYYRVRRCLEDPASLVQYEEKIELAVKRLEYFDDDYTL